MNLTLSSLMENTSINPPKIPLFGAPSHGAPSVFNQAFRK